MTQPTIVDSHCHLDFPDFEGEIPNLVLRAQEAGVKRMITICTRLKNEPKYAKLLKSLILYIMRLEHIQCQHLLNH